MTQKPFLKWAGGKTRVAPHILPHLTGTRLVEPFAGSCALFLQSTFDTGLLCDINPDLIRLYKTLQSEKEKFIDWLEEAYFDTTHNTLEKYMDHRAQFNALDVDVQDTTSKDSWARSGLFIYLNRHAFNGMCRYNRSGGFNVPYGKYKSVYFPRAEMTNFFSRMQNVTFECQSFTDTFKTELANPSQETTIYCDPPYIELSKTASFAAYATQGFSKDLQELLAVYAHQAAQKGMRALISNHDVLPARNLYERGLTFEGDAPLNLGGPCQEVVSFDVQRSISAKGDMRKRAPELLAIYKK